MRFTTQATCRAILFWLNDHAKSLEAVKNIRLADFHCRFLAVDDVWIALTESMLIEKFLPVC